MQSTNRKQHGKHTSTKRLGREIKEEGDEGALEPKRGLPEDMFHRLVGFCYFWAFFSLYMQWDGLFGYNGITPVDFFLNERVIPHFGGNIGWFDFPCLHIFSAQLGLNVEAFSQILMTFGMLSSVMIMVDKRNSATSWFWFLICWASYLSFLLIGQTFLSFQWDILLVEVGFIAIFSSSAPSLSPISWVYRFLAWKLMFLSGLVKLKADCPTWQELTALEFHFATQPLPTPLSHFAHSLPPILLRLGVFVRAYV